MNGEDSVGQGRAAALYEVLRRHLAESTEGRRVFTAFTEDPDGGASELAAYLRRELPQDDALAEQIAAALGGDERQFTTLVAGGQVDQIINIARLGVLNLTVQRYLYVFRSVWQVVATLIAVFLVGGGVWYGIWRAGQPRRLQGDFNIAVAPFGQVNEQGDIVPSGEATRIHNALFGYLDSEFGTEEFGLEVDLTHKNVPLIAEDGEAERLARRIHADVVIYGTVTTRGDSAAFYPRFYVADQPDSGELTGQSRLAQPIPFDLSQAGQDDGIDDQLRERAAILVLFTKGLAFLSVSDSRAALPYLTGAVDAASRVGTFKGQEVLLLSAAVAHRMEGQYDRAEARLDQLLALNPEYARAYIARGNVYFLQGIETWDDDLLDRAYVEYQKVLSAPDRPPGAYIEEKADIALGNIYVTRAQQTNDRELFAQAMEHYERVRERYESTRNERLRALAGLAYFGLGVAHERQGQRIRALCRYRRALGLTDDPVIRVRARQQIKIVLLDLLRRPLSAPGTSG